MESRSAPGAADAGAEIVVSGPSGELIGATRLSGARVTVGRLPEENDIALHPDPELLVTRVAHCAFERDGTRWLVVDGGSVNGTYLERHGSVERLTRRTELEEGDVVRILASIEGGERTFFRLAFHAAGRDSKATRAVLAADDRCAPPECLDYDLRGAHLLLVRGEETHELKVRAQVHVLVRHMAERNSEAGSVPVLCTHDELMHAVWADEPMHTQTELAKLVWELRRALEPYGAEHLVENERRRGYRLRTCPRDD